MASNVGRWFEEAVTGKSKYDKKGKKYAGELEDTYNDIETPEYEDVSYDTGSASEIDRPGAVKSKWDTMQTRDPEMRNRQTASMDALDRIAEGGGMTLTDQANLQDTQMRSASADKGRREAIQQTASRQGMTGGGNALLAQLASSQAATNQASQEGMDIAGAARERALAATVQSGDIAGDIRGQDFGEDAAKASAQDQIAQFNAENDIMAQKFNASQRQAMEIFNVTTGNAEQDMNNELMQREFMNSMALEDGRAQKFQKLLAYYQGMGDRDAKTKAGMLSGIIKGGAAMYTGGASTAVEAGANAATKG